MAPTKKNISIIPATIQYGQRTTPKAKTLRVAAYCRVSTLQEQQESSYEAQVSYYTEKITANANWTLAGIYGRRWKECNQYPKTLGLSGNDR